MISFLYDNADTSCSILKTNLAKKNKKKRSKTNKINRIKGQIRPEKGVYVP